MPEDRTGKETLMTTASADRSVRNDVRLLVLEIAFVVSGFCGLIYESIWSHYLKLFVGHAAYAQTVVLVVFIGGMAIGAWIVGRIANRLRAPLVAYAAVEAAVGAISLVFHQGFVALTEWGYATLLPAVCAPESPCVAQWLLAAVMILPQSVLLGATFPLMTAGILRLAPSRPGYRIALFYFLNSIGAVVGVLASAFVLIPALGLPGTLLTAGLTNLAVALAAYACGRSEAGIALSSTVGATTEVEGAGYRRTLLIVAALTGLSSFIYEVVWIRMLSLVIGASTDAFELMLAAFILGLALGGLWVRKRVDRFGNLVTALAIVQVLMGVAAVATLPLYDRTFDLLAWLLTSLNRTTAGYMLYNVAGHVIALAVMLPATFLAGMTLPLITAALLRGRQGESAIGYVYAANTLGAIAGVVLAVHFALPVLGLKGALLFGAGVDVALAAALLATGRGKSSRRGAGLATAAGLMALLIVGTLVPLDVERLASGVYRHGVARLDDQFEIVFHRTGKTANVDVLKVDRLVSIRTNGKSDAAISTDPAQPSPDEHTMTFAAVLPLSLRPTLQHAAVIGFGSGLTTATLLGSPNVARVDTIEIEPEMVNGARLFGSVVEPAYADPRSRIIIDDAKSYFARSTLRYDLVVSEPSNPWVSGVASLFTDEFYARVKRQLSDDGLFVQWIQAYEFSDALLATILRAVDEQFSHYAVYQANDSDMIIVAANRPLPSASDDFTRFPGLRPTLDRLSLASRDEIDLRRIAGASSVRALLGQLGPGRNSDYYPLVDLGAPRERFLRTQANALLRLAVAPVPIVEMLERRPDLAADSIPPVTTYHERRAFLNTARASAAWLVGGKPIEDTAPLPRDIGLLRAALWKCAELPPRASLRDLMHDVAVYVNPLLSRHEAARVWAAVDAAPCSKRMTADDRRWFELFTAVAVRDAKQMGALALAIASGDMPLRAEYRLYLLLAGATGLLADGDAARARTFVDNEIAKLPVEVGKEPWVLLVRGSVARGAS
jgi:predicted membrane-bound spermidine synthase